MSDSHPSVVIVGHPGVGKSALLAGLDAAGLSGDGHWEELPGVHMLGRNTPAECVVYDRLLGREAASGTPPAVVVALVGAQDLARQLYLVSQLIDLRLPLVVGVIGVRTAAQAGLRVDVERLERALGVPVVDVSPGNVADLRKLVETVGELAGRPFVEPPPHWRPSPALADAFHHVDRNWGYRHLKLHKGARFIEGMRLLGVPRAVGEYADHPAYETLLDVLETARKKLEDSNERWTSAEVVQRTKWIGQLLQPVVTKTKPAPRWRRWLLR